MGTQGTSRRNASRPIAVLGGTNIDFIGQSEDLRQNMDKIGVVSMRLGGAGFNVALYLAREGRKVYFWTILKSNSVVAKWVTRRLRLEKVNPRFITYKPDAGSGMFLAIKHEGEHLAAITQVAMNKAEFPAGHIRRIIKKSASVVADCNLSVSQITELLKLCGRLNRPATFLGISESLVLNYVNAVDLVRNVPVFALSVDQRSLASIKNILARKGIDSEREIPAALNLRVLSIFEGLDETSGGSGFNAKIRFIFDNGMEWAPGVGQVSGRGFDHSFGV